MSMVVLTPGEQRLLTLHRHSLVLFLELIPFLFLLSLPPLIWLVITMNGGTIALGETGLAFVTTILSLYYLYIPLFMLYAYFDFVLDIWVVTDERIINIEQKGLFVREASEQELDKVQDVTAEVKGLLPTIFNYGDIYIQTAGKTERFVFKQVQHPYHVVQVINTALDTYREKIRPA